jgi:membrane protease YdiL (CAAX protease family)
MKSLFKATSFEKKDLNTYIILLSAPVLLTVYRYHGTSGQFGGYFPCLQASPLADVYSVLYQFLAFFILAFLLPFLFVKTRLKRPLPDFGFGLGDRAFGLKVLLGAIPLLVLPLTFFASGMPDVRSEYPLSKMLFARRDLVLWYEAAYVLFYYSAWEFFFRGFLLFPLAERFGGMNAVLIQTISSCLVHIGKPEAETFGSIFAGIIFGALALRTRSFWYGFVLHAAIGVLTDLFILFYPR